VASLKGSTAYRVHPRQFVERVLAALDQPVSTLSTQPTATGVAMDGLSAPDDPLMQIARSDSQQSRHQHKSAVDGWIYHRQQRLKALQAALVGVDTDQLVLRFGRYYDRETGATAPVTVITG